MSLNKNYYVYINTTKTHSMFYTGVTNNITRRNWEHKNKTVSKGFTAKYNVRKLVYYQHFYDIREAIEFKKKLKKWSRKKKTWLIKKYNPYFKDLSKDWSQ